MPVQVTAIGKSAVLAAAVTRYACGFFAGVNAALFPSSARHGPKAGRGFSPGHVALPSLAVRRFCAFASVRLTGQASACSCLWFARRAAVLRRAFSSSGRPIRPTFAARCVAGRQYQQSFAGTRSNYLVRPSPSTMRRYSSQSLVSATNKPPPNLALQPTANGLPGLGLHFILAQTRQAVVCG